LDAPIRADGRDGFLIERLGRGFVLLAAQGDQQTPRTLVVSDEQVDVLALGRDIDDRQGLVAQRYDLKPGSVVLFRPDQHICMRSRTLDVRRLESAVARAVAGTMETTS
jgi:3-(3-hydroxy-phenyl)propionate hydroxylase